MTKPSAPHRAEETTRRRSRSISWLFVVGSLLMIGVLAVQFGPATWTRLVVRPGARAELAVFDARPHLGEIGPYTKTLLQRWAEGDDTLGRLVLDPDPIVWIRAVELVEQRTISQEPDEAKVRRFRDRMHAVDEMVAVRLALLPTYNLHDFVWWRDLEPWRESWRTTHPAPYSARVRTFLAEVAVRWNHPNERTLHEPEILRCRALDALLARWDVHAEDPLVTDVLRTWNAEESDRPELTAHARGRVLELLGDPRFAPGWYFDESTLSPAQDETVFGGSPDPASELRDFEDSTLVLLACSNHPRYRDIATRWRRGHPDRQARWSAIVTQLPELPEYLDPMPFAYGEDYGLQLGYHSEIPDTLLVWEVYGAPPRDLGFRLGWPDGTTVEAGPQIDSIEIQFRESEWSSWVVRCGGASLSGTKLPGQTDVSLDALSPVRRLSVRELVERAQPGPAVAPLLTLPDGPLTFEVVPIEELEDEASQ